jgi:hypothetical protein
MASAWGNSPSGRGKTVWFELRTPDTYGQREQSADGARHDGRSPDGVQREKPAADGVRRERQAEGVTVGAGSGS